MIRSTSISFFGRIMVGIAVLMFALALPAFAQNDRGAIVGTVHDPGGAVVPNATITVTNTGTGVSLQTKTNGSGEYEMLSMIPGTYTIEASAPGFTKQVQSGIEIHVLSRILVDFTMQLGTVVQTVEVSVAAQLLETQSADVGAVVGSSTMIDLPLNGRRYSDLALLDAGVSRNYMSIGGNNFPDMLSINGNETMQNDFRLDGIGNVGLSDNFEEGAYGLMQPPPDALEEFKLQTRTYSAEFGASAGGVINATIKSGSNSFHGDLWEFVRNNVFDSNTFFNNADGVPIGHYTWNQFGGTIGGPIRKDKTFFFADYQGFRNIDTETSFSVVPTPLMKQGIFTELPASTLSNLHDSVIPSQAGCFPTKGANAYVVQTACIDKVGQALMGAYPAANIPNAVAVQGQPNSWTGGANYFYPGAGVHNTDSMDARIDETINARNSFFGRYSLYKQANNGTPWTSNAAVGDNQSAPIRMQQVALSWTDSLTNSIVNEARIGFIRDNAAGYPADEKLGVSVASQYGLTGIPVGPYSSGLPPIAIAGLTGMGTGGWEPNWEIGQSLQLMDSLSWLKGKHSLKFGYQFIKRSVDEFAPESVEGSITADGIYTSNGTWAGADFMLGDIDNIRDTTPLADHYYQIGHSLYAQDMWRVKDNFTLNLGMRWDIFSPQLNTRKQIGNFTPANGGGYFDVASNCSGWYACSTIHPDMTSFAPRIGFAYHVTNRMVWRGGFGIYYQPVLRQGSESLLGYNPPMFIDAPISVSLGATKTVMKLDQGFPISDFSIQNVSLYDLELRAQDVNQRWPYVEQSSLGPEFLLPENMVLDVSWVGNFGHKEQHLKNLDQGTITGTATDGNPIITFPYANLSQPGFVTSENGGGYHAFVEYALNDGNSNYNGMLVDFRRPMTKDIGFSVDYTWAHGLSDYDPHYGVQSQGIPQNSNNYKAEYSNSGFNVKERLTGDLIWKLPFGQGERWLNGKGVDRFLGGWQYNTIWTVQTGQPFAISAPDESHVMPPYIFHDTYPNCIGNPWSGASSDYHNYVAGGTGFYINPAAFATPANGTFGNCSPRHLFAPGINNWDMSVFKFFPVTESKRFEFRAEFFNAFNHPMFNQPSANTSSPGSFGKVYGTSVSPRLIQLALKFYF